MSCDQPEHTQTYGTHVFLDKITLVSVSLNQFATNEKKLYCSSLTYKLVPSYKNVGEFSFLSNIITVTRPFYVVFFILFCVRVVSRLFQRVPEYLVLFVSLFLFIGDSL